MILSIDGKIDAHRCIALRENKKAFSRIALLPRIAMGQSLACDTSTVILGTRCSMPIYASATSLGRLAHPNGTLV